MPLGKKFFRNRSQFVHAPRYSVVESDAAPAQPRRNIFSAGIGLMLKSMARCGVCADLAFVNFPVAVVSWIAAQFFVGCAAYAEAMYPSIAYLPETEEAERNRSLARVNADRSPGLAPDLRDLSRFAIDDGARSPLPLAARTRSAVSRPDAAAKVVRLDVKRRAPSRPLVSITAMLTAWLPGTWLPGRRQPGGGHQSIVDLRSHDRRVLRGGGLSRYGIE